MTIVKNKEKLNRKREMQTMEWNEFRKKPKKKKTIVDVILIFITFSFVHMERIRNYFMEKKLCERRIDVIIKLKYCENE